MTSYYSDNLCCILILMLQWENSTRPDFVTLEHLIKNDILQMTDSSSAQALFKRLCNLMTSETDKAESIKISIPKASKGPFQTMNASPEEKKEQPTEKIKRRPIYEAMYEDVNEFLSIHSKVLTAQAMNVADSYTIDKTKQELNSRQSIQSNSSEAQMRDDQSKLLVRKLQESCDRARNSHNKCNLQMSSLKSGKGVEMVYETIIQNLAAEAQAKKNQIKGQYSQDQLTTQFEQRQKADLGTYC